MPRKKRQQANLPRQSKRMRPSDLTETAPETKHASLAAANSNTANLMTVDVNVLTSSIFLAVTEAVQRAFEKIPQTQVDKSQDKPTGVEALVDEEVSLLTQAVFVTRFDQSECVICRVIFALGKSRFQRYTW